MEPTAHPDGGAGGGVDAGTCPVAAGLSAYSVAALQTLNAARAQMGSPCAVGVPALETSAERHCGYVAANQGSGSCFPDYHTEVSGCPGFSGTSFDQRETAAGYSGVSASETVTLVADGPRAVRWWIDTVYHRVPLLSPWVRDVGFGSAPACDDADLGVGAGSDPTLVVTWPFAGQTGVPTAFNGASEFPNPPAPPGGWPSGYPISVFLKGGAITFQALYVDGTTTPLPLVTVPASYLTANASIFYAQQPLAPGIRYRVQIAGTNGAGTVTLNFTFTTQ